MDICKGASTQRQRDPLHSLQPHECQPLGDRKGAVGLLGHRAGGLTPLGMHLHGGGGDGGHDEGALARHVVIRQPEVVLRNLRS